MTGSAPSPDVNGSTAGLTHEWIAETAYYKAKVPIWIDEVPDFAVWKTDFIAAEAKEVVDAVGAWVYCFPRQVDDSIDNEVDEAMKSIQEVVEEHCCGSDVVLLAVATPATKEAKQESRKDKNRDAREDMCTQYGFEYVEYGAVGKNEFGEKVGFERLKEALEATEWAAGSDDELSVEEPGLKENDDEDGFECEQAESFAELLDMKAALVGKDEDDEDDEAESEHFITPESQAAEVEDLDRMLSQLLAVKEKGAEMPEEQRKRLAAKAVRDLMKNAHID